jgi:soluble lytic murein transglycosylase-like protein
MQKAEILRLIAEKEKEFNLPSGLLDAVVKIESNYNVDALGAAKEIGLAQLLPKGGAIDEWESHKGKGLWDYWNPEMNLHVAAWYLGVRIPQYLKAYGVQDSIEHRIWAYNAGIGNLLKGNKPQITANYIKKVNEHLAVKTDRTALASALLIAAALISAN